MASKLQNALHRIHAIKAKSEKIVDDVLQVAETSLATFGAGYANEKWGTNGELEVMGVPADLLAGVLLSGLAIAGAAGKHDHHALSLGAGLVGAYTYRLGASLGGGQGDVGNYQFGPFPWQNQAPAGAPAQATQGWGYSPRAGHNKTYVTSGNPEMG